MTPEDRKLLLGTFAGEAEDALAQVEELLAGAQPSDLTSEVLNELFRILHGLKGTSMVLDLELFSQVAHAVEDLLESARSAGAAFDEGMVELLLRAVDVLRALAPPRCADREMAEPAAALVQAISRRLEGQAPSGAPADDGSSAPTARQRTLRVDFGRLDRLLDLTAELTLARERVSELIRPLRGPDAARARDAFRDADRLYAELRELVMQCRMVSLTPAFQHHHRTVNETAARLGKSARLRIDAEDVEADASVLQHLREPVMHLLRNAVDHGLERPEVRRAAGKDECGEIVLRATSEPGALVIEVEDDGAGLDRAAILERARTVGLLGAAEEPADERLWQLVFETGFSTAREVTELSGRGVGLDVVRANVEALRGTVSIDTRQGKGTRIRLTLPLSVAIIDGFVVGVGEEAFVLPLGAIQECRPLTVKEREAVGRSGLLDVRGRAVRTVRLGAVLGGAETRPPREHAILLEHQGQRLALVVDWLQGASQLVVKPLGRLFRRADGVSGSALLGNGGIALILDVSALYARSNPNPGGGDAFAA